MAYKKLNPRLTEQEYRDKWKNLYCSEDAEPVYTFDGIKVNFSEIQFDHSFKESFNRSKKDKSILSLNRCVRMLWIRDALEDNTATLKVGWVKETKSYDNRRRVAIVKGNYVVIIVIINEIEANFITAFEIDNKGLEKILSGPNWKKNDAD